MRAVNRKPIFDAVKVLRGNTGYTLAEVHMLDAAIDKALDPAAIEALCAKMLLTTARFVLSPKGQRLMHAFEGCKLYAYPDPGSKDGNPWTIGWGSTGPGIHKGVVWTQQEADLRFASDVNEKYGKALNHLLGESPTTQNQFDAMCSLIYNIGIGTTNPNLPGGFTRSTVLRKHLAGEYEAAAKAFLMWNKNDGKVMRGLTARRLAEADLYDD